MLPITSLIAELKDCVFVGNENAGIDKPKKFDSLNQDVNALMWVNIKKIEELNTLQTGTVICPLVDKSYLKQGVNYFLSPNPRKTFANTLRKFFVPVKIYGISENAVIHKTATIGKNVSIGNFVVIHENVTIGDDVRIDDNTVIRENTSIGSRVSIGSNCTIGGVGFGYEKDDTGDYVLIPHIGNVVIENDVEIGNNTAIDRAVMGSTILKENVKVDNLVHIAHGVIVGKNSLVIANAMIAGSSVIGDNVWVAPSSSIINKVAVGNNSVIGMGAVVVKSISENDVVVGNPARSIKK